MDIDRGSWPLAAAPAVVGVCNATASILYGRFNDTRLSRPTTMAAAGNLVYFINRVCRDLARMDMVQRVTVLLVPDTTYGSRLSAVFLDQTFASMTATAHPLLIITRNTASRMLSNGISNVLMDEGTMRFMTTEPLLLSQRQKLLPSMVTADVQRKAQYILREDHVSQIAKDTTMFPLPQWDSTPTLSDSLKRTGTPSHSVLPTVTATRSPTLTSSRLATHTEGVGSRTSSGSRSLLATDTETVFMDRRERHARRPLCASCPMKLTQRIL